MQIELTKDEIALVQQGLVSALMRYQDHAAMALAVGQEGGISMEQAQAISAQFTKQADAANALYVKIVGAEKITIEETEERQPVKDKIETCPATCDHSTFHYCGESGTHCDKHCACQCRLCRAEKTVT